MSRPRPVDISLPACLLVLACSGAAARHEALGDRAYGEGRHADALVEYRLSLAQHAGVAADVHAKAAAAAMRAGDFESAISDFVALAFEGGDGRVTQGADGLEHVAQRAVDLGDRQILVSALAALDSVAPDRALGSFALELVRAMDTDGTSDQSLAIVLAAIAAAPDVRLQDSLMFGYAQSLTAMNRCHRAVPAFESLLRRGRERTVLGEARIGVGRCALALGQQALNNDQPLSAEEWFWRAATAAPETDYGRAAYLGLGDVLLARGDFEGARAAYESAMLGAAPADSIAGQAVMRLMVLESAGPRIP